MVHLEEGTPVSLQLPHGLSPWPGLKNLSPLTSSFVFFPPFIFVVFINASTAPAPTSPQQESIRASSMAAPFRYLCYICSCVPTAFAPYYRPMGLFFFDVGVCHFFSAGREMVTSWWPASTDVWIWVRFPETRTLGGRKMCG